ncbi:hypothetical protein GPECTOR_487g433 [Gonium pectorale]|uniref:Uncharacterized protein n=1 Tax=Gonium pectorale TaxID=33097 RepID=A0A150FUX7_GONPE|nr:hypothetical protein GPECTOR_487g433 [Gonium pectorale]|eukprot:KXZ41406.1 hypothetical protein GPECTOR_487g433 [Gonium pectorale]
MQACVPGDAGNGGGGRGSGGGAAAAAGGRAPSGGSGPAHDSGAARALTWQAAAATVIAVLQSSPAADSAALAACQAAAECCQSAILRLAVPPSCGLLHALLAATSGASWVSGSGSGTVWSGVDAGRSAPPLPALPLDLAPDAHPHPCTRLPRWCPADPEFRAFCTQVLAVQRRAVEVLGWQEARERAARHVRRVTHGSGAAGVSGSGSVRGGGGGGESAAAAGRLLMGRLAAGAHRRLRGLLLDLSESGGGDAADVVRMISCAQLLLSATLHAHALLPALNEEDGTGDDGRGDGGGGSGPMMSQVLGPAPGGGADPWVTPAQAWSLLARALAEAMPAALGEAGGAGGGGGGGAAGSPTAAAVAGSLAGDDAGPLQALLRQLQQPSSRHPHQRTADAGGSSDPPATAALAGALAAAGSALQRQLAALQRVPDMPSGLTAVVGPAAALEAAAGGQTQINLADDDDDDFGGRTRLPVKRARTGGGPGGGGAATGATQVVVGGGVGGSQMLTGPGAVAAAAAVLAPAGGGCGARSPVDAALAAAARVAATLEALAPLAPAEVSRLASSALDQLTNRRQGEAASAAAAAPPTRGGAGRHGHGHGRGARLGRRGSDQDHMEDDSMSVGEEEEEEEEEEIEDPDGDDNDDGDEGDRAGGGSGGAYTGAYSFGGRSRPPPGEQRSGLQPPPPPEELVAALARVAVDAAVAAAAGGSDSGGGGGGAGGAETDKTAAARRGSLVIDAGSNGDSAGSYCMPTAGDGGSGGGGGGSSDSGARSKALLAAALAAVGPHRGLLSLRHMVYDSPVMGVGGRTSYKVAGRRLGEAQLVAAAVQLRRLARHLGTVAATPPPPSGPAAAGGPAANAAGLSSLLSEGGVQVLREALAELNEAFEAGGALPYSWKLRSALAALAAELLPLDTNRFVPGPRYDLSDLVDSICLLPCRDEPSYRARRTGAAVARVLFRRFSAAEGLLAALQLPPLAGEAAEAGPAAAAEADAAPLARSLAETAVLMYAEVLQLGPRMEEVVVRRLLTHGSLCPRDAGLVAAALRLVAVRLGYAGPADYTSAFMRSLMWCWFTRFDLRALLAVAPVLVDGSAEADPDPDPGAIPDATASGEGAGAGGGAADPRVVFLRHHTGSVLLPLVLGGLSGPAEEVAELLGVQLASLLPAHVPYVFGTLLLLSSSPSCGGGGLLQAVADSELVRGHMDVGDVDTQLARRTYLFVASMLLWVVPDEEAAAAEAAGQSQSQGQGQPPLLPAFSAEVCCRALRELPGQPTPEANEAALWGRGGLLPPHLVAWTAAALHEALSGGPGGGGGGGAGPGDGAGAGGCAAAAPRHRARRVAGLGALLSLLGPRAAEPATGRYLCHILLHQLHHTPLQPAVCSLLHSLLDVLGLGHGGAGGAEGGDGEAAEHDAAAAAAAVGVSEEDRLATLAELLPPLVSAAVEALEAAEVELAAPPLAQCDGVFGLPGGLDAAAAADPCLASYSDATDYSPVSGLNERTAVVQAGRPALLQLLRRLVLGCPASLEGALASCRLLPELPELADAAQRQQVGSA